MSYLQTVYNYNTGRYETVIKKKFQVNKQKFDMISGMNKDNQPLEQVDFAYKFITRSPSFYSIDFGDYTLDVSLDLV